MSSRKIAKTPGLQKCRAPAGDRMTTKNPKTSTPPCKMPCCCCLFFAKTLSLLPVRYRRRDCFLYLTIQPRNKFNGIEDHRHRHQIMSTQDTGEGRRAFGNEAAHLLLVRLGALVEARRRGVAIRRRVGITQNIMGDSLACFWMKVAPHLLYRPDFPIAQSLRRDDRCQIKRVNS